MIENYGHASCCIHSRSNVTTHPTEGDASDNCKFFKFDEHQPNYINDVSIETYKQFSIEQKIHFPLFFHGGFNACFLSKIAHDDTPRLLFMKVNACKEVLDSTWKYYANITKRMNHTNTMHDIKHHEMRNFVENLSQNIVFDFGFMVYSSLYW